MQEVRYEVKPIWIPGYPVLNEENMDALLTFKGEHWRYESEWRLIVELNKTIGTGLKDQHDQPINLLRVPNEAVMSVYYTERTPAEAVEEVCKRLKDLNNRYTAENPTKLVMSEDRYGYEDAADGIS